MFARSARPLSMPLRTDLELASALMTPRLERAVEPLDHEETAVWIVDFRVCSRSSESACRWARLGSTAISNCRQIRGGSCSSPTEEEEAVDERTAHLRLDIHMLAARVVAIIEWLKGQPDTASIPIGLFGASTGSGGSAHRHRSRRLTRKTPGPGRLGAASRDGIDAVDCRRSRRARCTD